MKSFIALMCGLGCLGWLTPSLARSPFDRCERYQRNIEAMEHELRDLNEKQRILEIRLDKERRRMQRRCKSSSAKCEALEERAERLKGRLEPLYINLGELQKDIVAIKVKSDHLNHKTEKIEQRYQQLGCDHLEPGHTSQSVIDQCADLFSRWNQLQAEINALEKDIVALQHKYDRYGKRAERYEVELAELTELMQAHCSYSSRYTMIKEMDRQRHGYRSMKQDLEDMRRKMHRIRALKFKGPILKLKKDQRKIHQRDD